MSFYVYETTTEKKGEVEMEKVKNAERLKEIEFQYQFGIENGIDGRLLSDSDIEWLIEQAERTLDLEITCTTLASQFGESFTAHLLQQLNRREEENKRLREALEELRVLVLHCDADARAIQPYEVGDIVNQALDGVNHEATKT